METEFGLSELTDVLIKATQPITINGKTFIEGETIVSFDKIQIAQFQERKVRFTAQGGLANLNRVWWEQVKQVQLTLSQGIFSRTQLGILYNSQVIEHPKLEQILINCQEVLESDENGIVTCSHIPEKPLFVYDYDTGARISQYTAVTNKKFDIGQPYKTVLLDYPWLYNNGYSTFISGTQLTNGTFVLTGKTKVKDDITGQVRTGIIYIPKLKLMTNLSIQLGSKAIPMIGRMEASAYPIGPYGQQRVMEIIFLNDDIDSDM